MPLPTGSPQTVCVTFKITNQSSVKKQHYYLHYQKDMHVCAVHTV